MRLHRGKASEEIFDGRLHRGEAPGKRSSQRDFDESRSPLDDRLGDASQHGLYRGESSPGTVASSPWTVASSPGTATSSLRPRRGPLRPRRGPSRPRRGPPCPRRGPPRPRRGPSRPRRGPPRPRRGTLRPASALAIGRLRQEVGGEQRAVGEAAEAPALRRPSRVARRHEDLETRVVAVETLARDRVQQLLGFLKRKKRVKKKNKKK